jgi:hypothetical protein
LFSFCRAVSQCKTRTCHRQAVTISKKYKISSFWESRKYLSQKDIAQRFEIPTSTLGDWLCKNSTRIKQSFESSSYSADAKRHKKNRFAGVVVALLAWVKKMRINNPAVVKSGGKGKQFCERIRCQ